MNRKLVWLLLFTSVHVAEAQQQTKIPGIAYLTGAYFSAITPRSEAFRQGLRELGYIEGKNIVIEWLSAEGKLDRIPALLAELVHRKVDVIITGGAAVTRPAKEATKTIPIVMTQDDDPVGKASSLASRDLAETSRGCLVSDLS